MADVAQWKALVTGASSGIGEQIVRQIAASGGRVACVARDSDRLTELEQDLDGRPGDHLFIPTDVGSEDAVIKLVARVAEEFDSLDAVVNAAGICVPAPLHETDTDLWSRTWTTNVTGSFLVARETLALLRRSGGGAILNIGSEASVMGMPRYVAYCTSKAALVGLTKAMAVELAPQVRVNLLCPGPVDTPMLRAELALSGEPETAWRREEERVPLGRVASAAEVAATAVWLLRDARYATGAVVSLDGGSTL